MKIFKYTYKIIAILSVLALYACTDKDDILSNGGENVTVNFRPTLVETLNTRAIGDATCIDRLTVAVYEGGNKILSQTEDWTIAKRDGISLTLLEDHTYNILFWADDSENNAYSLGDDGKIEVDYTSYLNGGFDKMEQMDAFSGTSTITVGTSKNEEKQIALSRPIAQFNFADKESAPILGTHKAVVTLTGIPATYNPFTGEVTGTTNATFTFADFPDEPLEIENTDYYYLSSNYFFATAAIDATLDFQNIDGTSLKKVELTNIALEKNKKTNVLGTIVE